MYVNTRALGFLRSYSCASMLDQLDIGLVLRSIYDSFPIRICKRDCHIVAKQPGDFFQRSVRCLWEIEVNADEEDDIEEDEDQKVSPADILDRDRRDLNETNDPSWVSVSTDKL